MGSCSFVFFVYYYLYKNIDASVWSSREFHCCSRTTLFGSCGSIAVSFIGLPGQSLGPHLLQGAATERLLYIVIPSSLTCKIADDIAGPIKLAGNKIYTHNKNGHE